MNYFFADPIYVIIEYINGGTLQNILKKSRSIHEHNYRNLHGESQSLSSRDLTSFAYQVSTSKIILTSYLTDIFLSRITHNILSDFHRSQKEWHSWHQKKLSIEIWQQEIF